MYRVPEVVAAIFRERAYEGSLRHAAGDAGRLPAQKARPEHRANPGTKHNHCSVPDRDKGQRIIGTVKRVSSGSQRASYESRDRSCALQIGGRSFAQRPYQHYERNSGKERYAKQAGRPLCSENHPVPCCPGLKCQRHYASKTSSDKRKKDKSEELPPILAGSNQFD
jgi:hypothetical protein